MIDEKKIEEAADECAQKAYEEQAMLAAISFKEGVIWYLDNLWHDANRIPEEGKILIEEYKCGNNNVYYKIDRFWGDETQWLIKVRFERITRWLYIEDLLKGEKHE